MEAIIITGKGGPKVLQLQQRPVPVPQANEVLVKVVAAGINRPDVAQRKGGYPPPANAPQDIPGLEVAGYIDTVGNNVTRWQVGDAVCALLPGGGYAAYAIAHETHCLPVPENISLIDAAGLPETTFTVWHNVFQRGALQPGEHFLVHGGTSGIGITAIQVAKALGATVFTTAGSLAKCQACLQLGADIAINYKTHNFEEVLKLKGVDVVLDMIGGDYIAKNTRLLRDDGRMVFINAMKGGEAAFNAIDIMRRRLTITGSTLRNRSLKFKAGVAKAVEENIWPLFQKQLIKTVTYKTFPLADAALAHQLMESSEHIGKIILTTEN